MKRGERVVTIVSLLRDGVVTNVWHYGVLEQRTMEANVLHLIHAGEEVRVLHLDVHIGGA